MTAAKPGGGAVSAGVLPWPLLLASALAVLAGCSNVPPSNVRSNAQLTPTSNITRDLMRLPRAKARIPVAVYGFRDQTGQFKSSPDSAYSTLVTQGAASILVKALEDSGWFTPVEREGLQNLLTERRIVRAIESPTEKGKPIVNLPNMLPASMIIEGGVIGYESNVRTGGKGASYLGIGASTQYRVDQVTVSLRSVDVRTGQILSAVSVTKTLYSYQFSANLYKFTSYQHLLQGETGYSTNEPAQLAVREAIESAVVHLTVNGIRDRYFELQDPSQWDNAVIQTYLAEGLANIGEEPPGEEGLIPMRRIGGDRETVQPLPANLEEAAIERPRAAPVAPGAPAAVTPRSVPPAAAAPQATPATPATIRNPVQAPTLVPVPAPGLPAATKTAPVAAPPVSAVPGPARAATGPVAASAVLPAPAAITAPVAASQVPSTVSVVPPVAAPVPAASRASAAVLPAQGASRPAKAEDIFNQYWKSR